MLRRKPPRSVVRGQKNKSKEDIQMEKMKNQKEQKRNKCEIKTNPRYNYISASNYQIYAEIKNANLK